MKKHKCYTVYSLTPTPKKKDFCRLVEMFERKEDAELVLTALEKVNVSFNYYKIVEEYLEDVKREKVVAHKNEENK